MRDLAEFFAVLGEPSRLAILALLTRHGEMCVCEIQEVLELSQSSASRHLKALRQAGLLVDRRVGTWVHYRVTPAPAPRQQQLLEVFDRLLPAGATTDIDARVATHRAAAHDGCDPAAPIAVPSTEGARS
jgi:ArsR family transcriptional regulator